MKDLASQIVLGADGNLWFTEFGAIGVFSPTSGTSIKVNNVPLPNGSSEEPFGISTGPNGTIWYTAETTTAGPPASTSYAVGEISTSSESLIKETAVSSASEPFGITAGPDGNMWFTVSSSTVAGTIDSINPSTYAITTYAIPTNVVSIPNPVGITTGPDGNIWFTDGSGAIGVVANTQLVVTAQPPPDVSVDSIFGLTVTAEYANGVVDKAFDGSVSLNVAQGSGTLGGTKTATAANGVATFSGLTLIARHRLRGRCIDHGNGRPDVGDDQRV